jgi:hypothetical protein
MRTFTNCSPRQILLERPNIEEWDELGMLNAREKKESSDGKTEGKRSLGRPWCK